MKRTYIVKADYILTPTNYKDGEDTENATTDTVEHSYQTDSPYQALAIFLSKEHDRDITYLDHELKGHQLIFKELVDNEEYSLSDDELEAWQEGNFEAYTLHSTLNVYQLIKENTDDTDI